MMIYFVRLSHQMSRYHWSIPRYRNRFSRIYTCYRCSWQAHDAVVHVVASFGTKWFICRRCAVQKNAGKVAGRPKEPQERKYQWVFIRLIFAFFAGITHVMVPKRGVGRATPLGNGCILSEATVLPHPAMFQKCSVLFPIICGLRGELSCT